MEIELRSGKLLVVSGRGKDGTVSQLRNSPEVRNGWLASSVSLNFRDHSLSIGSVKQRDAESFAAEVDRAWIAYVSDQVEIERPAVDRVLAAIDELADPHRYPSACLVAPDLREARRLAEDIFESLPEEALEDHIRSDLSKVKKFASQPDSLRTQAIETFEGRQLAEWSEFFETFESNPLTPEQRVAIIADEDATLVLAGAGSGKTSVITAKAGYLIKSKTRAPHEILLLAFAKDAAKEMSERIEQRCGKPLEARTFHALAYEIIGIVEGSKPALASHATDDKAYLALIKDILIALVRTATEVSRAIIGWFSYARLDAKSEWDFKKKHDYYKHLEKLDLRTLQGEQVKSFEELMIANWLYSNGIEYEYEPNYEPKVSEDGYRDYCPDFRLKKSGVYIEHFGVRRRNVNSGTMELTTAPFVDRDEYLRGMAWKRGVHEEHETTLVETFSYERQEGRLLEALAEKIAPHEQVDPRSPETLFDQVAELGQVDSFVRLVGTFLGHYKGGGYSVSDCETKADKLKLGGRAKAFLSIFEPVYREYQSRLESEGRIDFEDMILRACNYAENGKYQSPFKHILVDEFQDISESRGRLVKALKTQHADGRVFAVGDDWQSIFRFAGSDINLMRKFGEEFGGVFDGQTGVHRTVDLGRTFRSVDQIAEAAMRFVLRNPAQLKKTVIPAGVAQSPALRVVPTFRHDADAKLKDTVRAIEVSEEGKTSVLLLGRYRHLRPDNLTALRREFPHLDISFKTIHASKGLEADHVIVLGLFRGRTGFPSEIVDDPLLGLVSPETEPFENAEERRVFYVALTRARQTVTLMSSASKQSAFVAEMLEDPSYGLASTEAQLDRSHTCGECGGHLLAFPTKAGAVWYRCEHVDLCGFSINACPSCGIGLPEKEGAAGEMKCRNCGAKYPACPDCDNGWLVERKSRYGKFLGCVSFPRCKGKGKIE